MKWAAIAAALKAAYEKVKKFFSSTGVTQRGEGNRNISAVSMGNVGGNVHVGDVIHNSPLRSSESTSSTASDIRPKLSSAALELIEAFAALTEGRLSVHLNSSGLFIQVGSRSFCGTHDSAEQAKWIEAVDQLRRNDLIRATSTDVYRITQNGLDAGKPRS